MHARTLAVGAILATALSSATALASADAATTKHSTTARAGSYHVTAEVNKTEPMADDRVKIKATVTPAAPGARVSLQLRYADQNTWKTVDHARLDSRGKVTFKDKVTSVRTRTYRVLKPADAKRGAGHAKTSEVVVYGWRNLTSIQPVSTPGFLALGVNMNGVSYPDSLTTYSLPTPPSPPTHTAEYNLNRDCKAFRGVAGLDDRSSASGTAQVQLSTDGAGRYTGAFALTQSAAVAFDLTGVFRLTVSATVANGGIAALGTPQVLCSF